jgi:hypothetical protein
MRRCLPLPSAPSLQRDRAAVGTVVIDFSLRRRPRCAVPLPPRGRPSAVLRRAAALAVAFLRTSSRCSGPTRSLPLGPLRSPPLAPLLIVSTPVLTKQGRFGHRRFLHSLLPCSTSGTTAPPHSPVGPLCVLAAVVSPGATAARLWSSPPCAHVARALRPASAREQPSRGCIVVVRAARLPSATGRALVRLRR